jgi:colanic acid biosynthesis glycosyl transferase WcaI
MRFILINRFFHPDTSPTSLLLTDLASHLAGLGQEVQAIASARFYGNSRIRLARDEIWNGVRIHRVWAPPVGNTGVVSKLISFLFFYMGALGALLGSLSRGDVVIVKTDPPLIGVLVSWIARLRGARVVHWLQDLYPEVAQRATVRSLRWMPLSILRSLRNRSLRRSAACVVIGERMREQLLRSNIPEPLVEVIHNWADGEVVRPLEHADNSLRRAWGLEGKFVVAYSGNTGLVHGYQTLLDAAERLREFPSLLFLWIGGGGLYEQLRREVEARGLKNWRFEPHQPRERLAQSLGSADLHVAMLDPAFEGLVVPSKFYGIAAAGRPCLFIGNEDGEIARLIRQHDCGAVVKHGDAEAVVRAITDRMSDPGRARREGKQARSMFDRHFARPLALQRWEQLLQRAGLLAGERRP